MTRSVILAGVAVVLAACSPPASTSSTTQSNSGAASAPTAAASGVANIQPGQYRTTVNILSMSIPGIPAAQLQSMQARPQSDEDCVTSDDINEFAHKGMMSPAGESCSENHVSAANGHVEGSSTCTDSNGETRTSQITGSFTSTHIEMDVTMSGQSSRGPMSEHIRMVADRIGDCPAGSGN